MIDSLPGQLAGLLQWAHNCQPCGLAGASPHLSKAVVVVAAATAAVLLLLLLLLVVVVVVR